MSVSDVSKRYRLGRPLSASLRETVQGWLDRSHPTAEAGWIWALKNVDFEVPAGSAFAIIGRNGAGKSTILKILSRITPPTEGRVELRGRVASLLEIGTGFHPELTGRENVFLNGAILGMTREEIRRKFDAIVAFSGVERFLDTPVKHYSTGMHVRLAFAVAAHLEPEILIIDEVLAVGDAEFQRKCLGKMETVAGSGRTVLFVSHNMQAVSALCDQALLLEDGRVVERGSTGRVVARYLAKSQLGVLETTWAASKAPGAEGLLVERIAIVPQFAPGEDPIVNVTTPLDVEFEFTSDRPVPTQLNLSLHLLTMHGECVFNVGSDPIVVERGRYRGVCQIPGHLLNNGIYHVTMLLVKDTTTVLYSLERALTFEVGDHRENSLYFGKWPGYVRPRLPFHVSAVSPAAAAASGSV